MTKNDTTIELPDCVISYIFSKLSLKDLLKTSSTLSKQWLHERGFRTDLNFDLHNMFDNNTTIQERHPVFQSEFATRLNKFMSHYQGDIIRSIRVKFPLGDEHSYAIDSLISQGIAKGANSIELLFSYDDASDVINILEMQPYKFPFTLLSESDSLKCLHLEKCLIVLESTELSGLKNLNTLVLHQVVVKQDMIQTLFSNCMHLVDFTLNACKLKSDLKIISSTLLYLNIVHRSRKKNIDIIASNLSSFGYSYNHKYAQHNLNIEAPMLSKLSYNGGKISKRFCYSGMKNVTTIVLDRVNKSCIALSHLPLLFSECLHLEDVTLKNCNILLAVRINIAPKLRHLKIIDSGCNGYSTYLIDINAPNLSSFEYNCDTSTRFSFKAPRLLNVFWNVVKRPLNLNYCGLFAGLHLIENLSMVLNQTQIVELSSILVQFQNLRQLKFFIKETCDLNMDYFWILDIAMASQHLQKLSLTIRSSHMKNSHMIGFKRQIREYVGFSHNNLRYVELCGCVCTINAIVLASHIMRNVNSLQQITFNSRDKLYIGVGIWTEDFDCGCWFERNLIHQMLKDKANENCQLIIL